MCRSIILADLRMPGGTAHPAPCPLLSTALSTSTVSFDYGLHSKRSAIEVEDIYSASLILLGLDSRLTVWRYSCMLMCACAKRLELRPRNKIREILCSGPSVKIYTLEIYPLYGNSIGPFYINYRLH